MGQKQNIWKWVSIPWLLLWVLVLSSGVVHGQSVLRVQAVSWNGGGDFYPGIAQAFEELHPGVTVEFVSTGSRDETREKIPVMAAAGTLPDVFLLQHRVRNSWIRLGIVEDLTPYVEREPSTVEGLVPYAREFIERDGKIWGVPETWEVWIAHIKRDAFDEAGLEQPDSLYARGEWTFDILPEIGKKLTRVNASNEVEHIGIYTNADNEVGFPWAWGYGAEIVSPDGTQMHLDHPGVRQGFEFLAELLNVDRVAQIGRIKPNVGTSSGKWGIGFWWSNLMYYLNVNWNLPFTYDVLPFPAGPESDVTNLIGLNTAWSIASTSTNKDLAWEFIKFVSSPEVDRQSITQRNTLPNYIENVELAAAHLGESANAKNLFLLFEALLTRGRPYNDLIDLAISTEYTNHLMRGLAGEVPVAEALSSAKPVIDQMVQETLSKLSSTN